MGAFLALQGLLFVEAMHYPRQLLHAAARFEHITNLRIVRFADSPSLGAVLLLNISTTLPQLRHTCCRRGNQRDSRRLVLNMVKNMQAMSAQNHIPTNGTILNRVLLLHAMLIPQSSRVTSTGNMPLQTKRHDQHLQLGPLFRTLGVRDASSALKVIQQLCDVSTWAMIRKLGVLVAKIQHAQHFQHHAPQSSLQANAFECIFNCERPSFRTRARTRCGKPCSQYVQQTRNFSWITAVAC
mmetsp:Transcript_165069/g.524396  ORF Transcript_165069/g.524396 Transcript_165069/m.524396 type:complete len:240 (-) Transcript_165069:23-742(-)